MEKVRLVAVVGVLVIVGSIVAFMGTGSVNEDWPKVTKTIMMGLTAALGVGIAVNDSE